MAVRVVLRTNEYALSGKVDQVELFISGQWYRRDIRNSYDIKMAQKLADDMNLKLEDYRSKKGD